MEIEDTIICKLFNVCIIRNTLSVQLMNDRTFLIYTDVLSNDIPANELEIDRSRWYNKGIYFKRDVIAIDVAKI